MGDMRNAYTILVGKPEVKRPIGRPRRRREDNIRIHIREIGWGSVDGCMWLRIGISGGLL
jgi:hypothetical protein